MNVQQLQTDLDTVKAQARQIVAKGAAMTADERATVEGLVERGKSLKQRIDAQQNDASMTAALADLLGQPGGIGGGGRGPTLGAQIVNSEVMRNYNAHKKSYASGSTWDTPIAEFGISMMATTITEDPASGGKLILPDTRPGIVQLPTRRLVVADLILPGTTTSNNVQIMRENTFTNAAAPVAEGGTKPESALMFDTIVEPVRKIACWIPVTEEMLEDVQSFASYIDARLITGVQLTEDDQLLNGNGTPPNFTGFLARSGLATPVVRGSDTNADAIFKQISAIESATNLPVDAIVMNPINWQSVILNKIASGEYSSGSSPLQTPVVPSLWGRKVALTSAIVAGTALVGAFQSASQLFRNGGMKVHMTNSHQDFFIKNLVAGRSETRAALVLYRPSSFGVVTGLT